MKKIAYRQMPIMFFGLIVLAQMLFLPSIASAVDSSKAKQSAFVEGFNFIPNGLPLVETYGITRQVDPYFKQQAYLKADNVGSGDKFGHAAAIEGDTLVIGAPGEDTSGINSGAVYVFVRSGESWTQQAFLKASNSGGDDNFGIAVDIDGDTIVVGAYGEASNGSGPADNSALQAGAAYVFVREGDIWAQQGYLKSDSPELDDQFGEAVAVDGDTIVVGVQTEDEAFVFERVGVSWAQQDYLTASNDDVFSDYFGCSVGISGDVIVVGAELEGEDPADDSLRSSGAAYVFVLDPKLGWTEQAYLKADNLGKGDNFGFSVSISGDLVVIGAPHEESNGSNPEDNSVDGAGAAYVFQREETTWTQQAYLKASNVEQHDNFGHDVAIDGNSLVISAIGKEDSGAVYVFSMDENNWSQQAYLRASNSDVEDGFGPSNGLDISGNFILVGANYEDGDGSNPEDNSAPEAGAAYVFDKSFTFSGNVYQGPMADENHPLSGVGVSLYCSADAFRLGTKIANTTTGTAGAYALETFDVCDYYNIYEVDSEGYFSLGASSEDGVVLNENRIRYSTPLDGQNLSNNKFWDELRKLFLPLILR